DAQLIEDRLLRLQSSDIRMATRDSDDGESYPLNISLADQGVSLAFDWINLARFAYTNNQIEFTFLDSPRTSTTRDGANLLSLEAVGDVIHIVYKGTNAPERLILPADENYLEVITPGGEPRFGGAAFNGTALPGEPGFQPRALNNLGGECYPVNTTLEIANCAPNGDINPANGNLWYSVVDHAAHHPVYDLMLTRSYNSAVYMQDGAFGYGWVNGFPVDYDVAFDPEANARVLDLANANPETRVRYRAGLDPTWAARGIVTLTMPSGSQHTFVRQSTSGRTELFTAITMPGWRLTRTGANRTEIVRSRWTLTLPDGLTYEYDRAGRLRSVGYPSQGHQITITYPSDMAPDGLGAFGDGLPVIITDNAEMRQLKLYYDADHHIVRSILRDLTMTDTDACLVEQSCFEITYEYTDGHLTRVNYPGGQTATYTYDGIGRLIRHDD